MEAPLAFRPRYDVFVLDDRAALLRSDTEEHLLHGALHAALAPLLDGAHSEAQILDALAERHPLEEILYALARLRAREWIDEVSVGDGGSVPSHAPDGGPRYALRTAPSLDSAAWAARLRAAGLAADEGAERTLFVARDLLDPAFDAWNRAALAEGRPWLPAACGRGLVWVGPLVTPGAGACWACLAHRLARLRVLDPFVHAHGRPVALPRASGPPALDDAALVVRHAADAVPDVLVRIDPAEGTATRHRVGRRPQCPACGDAGLYARRVRAPVVLRSAARERADGGYRTVSAESTVARLEEVVDPVAGVVPGLRRIAADAAVLPVYVAGAAGARPWRSLEAVRRGLRSQASGKGLTGVQARASALGEAVERYCGTFQGDEPRMRASLRELGADAIDPDACQLFSERQLRGRGRGEGREAVPAPFDAAAALDWTPVWSLTRRTHRWLPTALLYHGAPDPDGFFATDSNGAAAGNTLEEAVLQGLLELVERDAAGIWWYGRHVRPGVDPDDLGDARIAACRDALAAAGQTAWLLDLTTDLGIPVLAAVSRPEDPGASPLIGLGCHPDPAVAAGRAFSELAQMQAAVAAAPGGAEAGWLHAAAPAALPYIAPSATRAVPPGPHGGPAGDLLADIEDCRGRLEAAGHEVLVLDQSRPDVDFAVVRVVVPGLRHIRPRFAPGRLYSVPLREGWIRTPLDEGDLNPLRFLL